MPARPPVSTLSFWHFDHSEDGHGAVNFDAMASARPSQLTAMLAELAQVLGWFGEQFGAHTRGPLEEGGSWDWSLSAQLETSQPQNIHWDAETGRVLIEPDRHAPPLQRHSLSLSISAAPEVAQAFSAAFGLDADGSS